MSPDAAQQILLAVLLVVLMAGMGATLTWSDFGNVRRDPRGVLIGVASQFGWMPLIAYLLATTLDLPDELALGLILIGCTPGGTTSNLFSFFTRADVALSISMTATSTLLAVVAMPLLLHAYAGALTSATLSVPTSKIAVTLALVLVPVALGMGVRARYGLTAAGRLERGGTLAGVLVLVVLIVSGLVQNRALFAEVAWPLYVASASLGACGMGLGWLSARLARLPAAKRRAIAFETGIQNSPLAIAIVLLAFDPEQAGRIVQVPLLYALSVLLVAALVTGILRLVDRRRDLGLSGA